ncbi:MAG: SdrD B-like domain-containing protein [Patescibacteria group bacterium]
MSNFSLTGNETKIFWGFFIIFLFLILGSFLIFGKVQAIPFGADWKKIPFDSPPLAANGGDKAISSLAVFNNLIYFGTYNGVGLLDLPDYGCSGGSTPHILRQKTGEKLDFASDVEDVFTFPSPNCEVSVLKVYRGYLYAGTWASATGAEIWRSSNGTSWTKIVDTGFTDPNNTKIVSLEIYNNYLYAGTRNQATGGEVWRCSAGGCSSELSWSQVNSDGFGDSNNDVISSLKSHNGRLYASTNNGSSGTQIWYCSSCDNAGDWSVSANNGFGDGNSNIRSRLESFGSFLYAGTYNINGLQLKYLRVEPTGWQSIISGGFGDSNNKEARSIYSYSYKNGQRLVIGTGNASGAQIWESETPTNASSWTLENALRANELITGDDSGVQSIFSLISPGLSDDNHLYAGTARVYPGLWKRNFVPNISFSLPSQQTDGSGKVNIEFVTDDYDGDELQAKISYSVNGVPCNSDPTLSTSEISVIPSEFTPIVNNADEYQISGIAPNPQGTSSYTINTIWNSKTDEPNTYSTNSCAGVRVLDNFYSSGSTKYSDNYQQQGPFTLDNVSPNSPTLNAVTSPTKDTPQTISGTKEANSSVILLNGNTIVGVNANTTWSYSLDLLEGVNNLSLKSRDAYGNESNTIGRSITLDQSAPACSVSPASGTYAGEVEVKIEANDNLDPHPYIFYTTDGTEPTLSSPKSKDKKTLTFDDDTTLKFFCQDWVENKTSTTTREYKIVPPQITLTKSAATSFGGGYPLLSLAPRDILLPTPKSASQNIFAILFSWRDFLISQTEKFNLSPEILFAFLRGLSIVILGLTLIYLLLVFDLEWRKFSKIQRIKSLKETRKSFSFLAMMRTRYGQFAYILPAVLIFAVFIHLLLGFSLIAQNVKVKPKEIITYTLVYQNIQKKKATDVKITDPLPNYVDYLEGGNLENNQVKFNIGTVSGNSSGTVQFRVKVKETAPHLGLIENQAEGTYGPEKVSFESNVTIHEVEATGRIAGYIFYDSNANKLRDSGESGISGAKLLLYRDIDNNEKFEEQKDYLSKTTNTDSSGYYEFTNTSAGTYFVKSEAPSENYQLTSSSDYQIVKLATSLDIISNINFGYLISIKPTPTTTISPTSPTTTVFPTTTISPTFTISPTATPTPTASPSPTPFIKKITKPITKITEKITQPVKKIQEKLKQILPEKFTQAIFHPQTQKATKNIFSPLLAILPILNLFFAFPGLIFGQFLRYLFQIFTEPFLYFGKKAWRGWGVVYDSLTKQPVDLATIRLYEKASGKLLESKVTDFEGRYIFIVDLGREYYLKVQHRDYDFPSKILGKARRDSDFNNLYFGEVIATGPISDIHKKEKGIIAFNVPIDSKLGMIQSPDLPHRPIYSKIKTKEDFAKLSEKGKKKENQKIFLALTLRRLNYFFGFLGPILAFISLILIPSLLTLIFFIVHLILLSIFLKLARGKKILPWGKTYELKTKEGLSKTLIRLFDEKYGRLLATTVTKSGGRYSFLTGKENYIVIPYKQNYYFPDQKVKVKPTRERFVKEDLGMKKIN